MSRRHSPPPTAPFRLLLTGERERDCLVHVEHVPARPASMGQWPGWADPQLVAGYRSRGIDAPWAHQSEAAEQAWAGRHVVLATSTGSGKSLPAWLTAVTAIRSVRPTGRLSELSRRPTALYLSPTKALAADQLHGLQSLLDAAGIRDVRATTVDGDTGMDERDWARDHADIVLTNPDFLHFSMLPATGAGSGCSGVALRRRRRVPCLPWRDGRARLARAAAAAAARGELRRAADGGARVRDDGRPGRHRRPAAGCRRRRRRRDHARRLARGRRTVALWQPPLADGLDPDDADENDDAIAGTPDAPRRSTLSEVADLLVDLVTERRRTLAFVRSRLGTEVIADHARSRLRPQWQPPGRARAGTRDRWEQRC